MSRDRPVAPDAPRQDQTVRLPAEALSAFHEWAVDGTALTAAARVRDPTGRVALVKNRWSDGWLPPGGAVELGETAREAAEREVREEIGLDATVGDPLVVLDQTYVDAGSKEAAFTAQYVLYAATSSGTIPSVSELGVDEDEITAAQWFASVPEDLHDGDLLRPYL